MNVTNLILGIAIGLIWLTACCVIIHKIGAKKTRTTLYIVIVILFILLTGVFAGTRIGAVFAKEVLHLNAVQLDEYLVKNHGDVRLVRGGVDAAAVPQAIDELEAMIPLKISEFGLSGIILESMYKNALSKGFDMIRSKTGLIVSFANEDGKITSSTIIQALEWEINSIISRIIFYSTLVTGILMALYLGLCVILAVRKPGKNEG